jgi:hypothetical protein
VCPKCGGAMVRGYVTEFANGRPIHSGVAAIWVEGSPPEASFWHGGAQVPAERCVPVATLRCSACGLLESYARAELPAD